MREEDVAVDKIAAWELFVASLKPQLEDMPCLQPFHDGLQGLIEEARALEERQERVRKEAREHSLRARPVPGAMGRPRHPPSPSRPRPEGRDRFVLTETGEPRTL